MTNYVCIAEIGPLTPEEVHKKFDRMRYKVAFFIGLASMLKNLIAPVTKLLHVTMLSNLFGR